MLHAKFPPIFWGKCILTTTYLINKLHVVGFGWKSPFETLLWKPPAHNHLRTVGSLTYATVLSPSKSANKFAPRGRKSIFVGYPINQKGQKLYDLSTNEFFLSRDVTFVEYVFPFHLVTLGTEPSYNDSCLPIVPFNSKLAHSQSSSFPNPSHASNDSFVVCPPIIDTNYTPVLRRSSRSSHSSTWLQDYVLLMLLQIIHPPFISILLYPLILLIKLSLTIFWLVKNLSLILKPSLIPFGQMPCRRS